MTRTQARFPYHHSRSSEGSPNRPARSPQPATYCIYMLSITLTIAACQCFEWLMHEGSCDTPEDRISKGQLLRRGCVLSISMSLSGGRILRLASRPDIRRYD